MNYYNQLLKSVLPHLRAYKGDLTTHDKKALKGYTGHFLYAYRDTGTNLFKTTPYFEALEEVLKTGKSSYFTPRGLDNVLAGTIDIGNMSLSTVAIFPGKAMEQDYWMIGDKGKIKKVTPEQMTKEFERLRDKELILSKQIVKKYSYLNVESY